MIKTQRLVPEVYYNRSRDFQLLGRIYDIVFNYLKTNTDVISNVPYSENIDDKLISLVSSTLGFKELHQYNTKQLRALCSTFVSLLRTKGTKKSIETLLTLILNVEEVKKLTSDNVIIDEDNHLVQLFIPSDITDTSLLEDVLHYILPAGMSYRIIKEQIIEANLTDEFVLGDEKTSIKVKQASIFKVSQLTQKLEDYGESGEENVMKRSTDVGFGRIEDMNLGNPDLFTNTEDDVPEEQNVSDIAADIYPETEE